MIRYYNANMFKLLHNFQGRRIATITQRRHKTNQLSTNSMNTMCSQLYGYKTTLPPQNTVSKYPFHNPKYIPTGILKRKASHDDWYDPASNTWRVHVRHGHSNQSWQNYERTSGTVNTVWTLIQLSAWTITARITGIDSWRFWRSPWGSRIHLQSWNALRPPNREVLDLHSPMKVCKYWANCKLSQYKLWLYGILVDAESKCDIFYFFGDYHISNKSPIWRHWKTCPQVLLEWSRTLHKSKI